MSYLSLIGFSLVCSLLFLVTFAVLHWLNLPTGNLVDWLIGIASFWWLMAIVTIPWNIYFEAKGVRAEAAISREKKIAVDQSQLSYVKKVEKWSLIAAILIHLLSAIGLYWLAATGISVIGYVSSAATLLLTGLRPAWRAYQYLASRLAMIREQVKFPREDILTVQNRLTNLETNLKALEGKLDLDNPQAWATQQQQQLQYSYQELLNLKAFVEQFQAKNHLEHQELSKEARQSVAQLAEDSQFLSQVREIIRFVKTA